jgi:hypothetical protein
MTEDDGQSVSAEVVRAKLDCMRARIVRDHEKAGLRIPASDCGRVS